MGKLTDRQIRHWIKADERFEHRGDGDDVKPAHIDAMLQTIVKRSAPSIANDVLRWVWQMFDFAVKRHIVPGHGWRYAVTVIDYYSRYLLACHFTPSYTVGDVVAALDCARAEPERLHGLPLKTPFLVTDNGPSFLARRFQGHMKIRLRSCLRHRPEVEVGRGFSKRSACGGGD